MQIPDTKNNNTEALPKARTYARQTCCRDAVPAKLRQPIKANLTKGTHNMEPKVPADS